MERRTAGTVVALIGLTLVAFTLGVGLLGASNAWERMSADFRPVFTEQATAQARADLQGLQAIGTEFTTKGLPALAQALGRSPAEVAQLFGGQFPATGAALLQFPAITARLDRQVRVLETERARFVRADETPNRSLSSTAIPWFIIAVGIASVLAGAAMFRGAGALPLVGAVLGVVMISVPLAFSLPSKASNADTLNDHLRPVLTSVAVAQGTDDVATLRAMANELQTKLVPTLTRELRATPEAVQAFLRTGFPALTGGLPQVGPALERFAALTTLAGGALADFDTVQAVTYTPVPWIVIGCGIIAVAVSLWALAMSEVAAAARDERRAARRARRLAA